jgi:peptidyl-prolyl cis-trans isomerase C
VTISRLLPALVPALIAAAVALATPAAAQDKVVAKVNDKSLTEADVRHAEAEIGSELGNLPPETRRRVLVEYLIENQLFSDAAETEKLGSGSAFDERMQYWRRRALRDTYFDRKVKDSVTEADAKKLYDQQVAQVKTEDEVRARHILVETQEKAKEIFEKIAHGGDFAKLAAEHSRDPGSKDSGGELGFFGRGQMVPQFEETAFKMKAGDVSQPVQTQFGWHLIKVDEKRTKKPPEFAAIKDRMIGSMIQRKAQEIASQLRDKAKLEYIDPDIKKQVEAEQRPGAQPNKQ